MNEQSTSPGSILIMTEGQLGDLLLITPLIRDLRRTHPCSRLLLLVAERRGTGNAPPEILFRSDHHLLSSNRDLSAIYCFRRDRMRQLKGIRRVVEEINIARFIRGLHPDLVISTFPEDRFALWAFVSGARVRIGETRGMNRKPDRQKGIGSILEYFRELSTLAGSRETSIRTEYVPTGEAEQWADRFLASSHLMQRRFVIIHPGATGDYKIWPPERYGVMIESLSRKINTPILLCGGPMDREVVGIVAMHSPGIQVHIEDDVARFASLLKRAALLVSNDSGPRHLAVAVGTPSLAIFRQFHDREWGIYPESDSVRIVKGNAPCSGCPPGRCDDLVPSGLRYGSVCLQGITSEEVTGAAMKMLTPMASEGRSFIPS